MVWKPHVTVAAIVEKDGRFLVVEEEVHGQRVLNNPAGHLEPGESFLDAVRRETLEETGWEFLPDTVTGIYLWKNPAWTRVSCAWPSTAGAASTIRNARWTRASLPLTG